MTATPGFAPSEDPFVVGALSKLELVDCIAQPVLMLNGGTPRSGGCPGSRQLSNTHTSAPS